MIKKSFFIIKKEKVKPKRNHYKKIKTTRIHKLIQDEVLEKPEIYLIGDD